MASLTMRKVTHTRFPLGYSVTLETKTGIFTAVRIIDGTEYRGYYTDKAAAISEQSNWYNDECINRERKAKADSVEHGACLSHIPEQCGCGDCLTYLAGQ